jgi:hypothetical protein
MRQSGKFMVHSDIFAGNSADILVFYRSAAYTKRPRRTVEVHVLRVSSFVFASQSRREGMWSS